MRAQFLLIVSAIALRGECALSKQLVAPPLPSKCDYTKTFENLIELDAFVSSTDTKAGKRLPIECNAYYALDTLSGMLDIATVNYSMVDTGYDELFTIYKDYMRDHVPSILENFMFKITRPNGLPRYVDGPGMKYFDCSKDGKTTQCADRGSGSLNKAFDLRLRDTDGFNTELGKLGLSPDWIGYGNYEVSTEFSMPRGGGMGRLTQKFTNFPIRNDAMVVPNPKDIVASALKNYPSMRQDMQATLKDIQAGTWKDTTAPPIVYSVPVLVLMQGVENMAQAKIAATGMKAAEEKAREEKKKNLILLVLSIVFIFIPIVGQELAAAAGLATLARSIIILGELGNGALAIYDTVKNPEAAVVNIIGGLFGLAGIAKAARTETSLARLADARGGISQDTMLRFGSVFSDNNKLLANILKCT